MVPGANPTRQKELRETRRVGWGAGQTHELWGRSTKGLAATLPSSSSQRHQGRGKLQS